MSNIQHGMRVDLASMPNMDASKHHQCLYLDGDMMTWLDVDPCQGEDPSSADLAADWLDALAAEASKLAGWYRSQARHARGTCPPVCDGCGKCCCHVDTSRLVAGGTWTMCPDCARKRYEPGITATGRSR